MNNIQKRSKDFDEINDYFIEKSYEKFDERLSLLTMNNSLSIINEGIIPVETFLYFLWLTDENCLDILACVKNHEGAWEFYIIDAVKKTYFEKLKNIIHRIFSFQEIDEVSQLVIETVETPTTSEDYGNIF